ncbi:hypothetical protein [Bythopirellula polymerisocia]|uniref:Uncharacterized protein n=1 Tax=Bythopirellula polymerisocia TaxID=2528003 RepID=A0A5C6CCV9_9BACT|nr:hypothetical protein [Bythopirellula polymerisocia]TWU21321.1 hypothetical protein Pla144_47310 [Bythopirellula polymerisocia]
MHAIEIINYRNANACGISIEQNRKEALAGQYIRRPNAEVHKRASVDDAVNSTNDFNLSTEQKENSQ